MSSLGVLVYLFFFRRGVKKGAIFNTNHFVDYQSFHPILVDFQLINSFFL